MLVVLSHVMTWYVLVRFGMVWYGTVWWYAMVWHGLYGLSGQVLLWYVLIGVI